MHRAFEKVASTIDESGELSIDSVVAISSDFLLPVEDVLVLEKVAKKNPETVKDNIIKRIRFTAVLLFWGVVSGGVIKTSRLG